MQYTKLSVTTAEKTVEVKSTISIESLNNELAYWENQRNVIQSEIDRLQKEIEDLKALGLKTEAEVAEAVKPEIEPIELNIK